MSNVEIGVISLGVMVVLVYGGLWVPFALMLTSYAGVWVIKGSPLLAGKLLALAASRNDFELFLWRCASVRVDGVCRLGDGDGPRRV